jgi:hypothetical protein
MEPRALAPFVVLVVVLALAWAVPVAGASTSSDAVGAINAMRARMGLPAVANDERLAGDCGLHASWMRANGRVTHDPPAGSPGYTALGADAAARSVLHRALEFTPQSSEATVHWRVGAPLHLYQLLHPGLVRSGYAFDGSFACMWTLDPRVRTGITVHDRSRGRGKVYTWPVAGAGDIPAREDTSGEDPNPNVQLGLPRSQVTGPYFLVYGGGFGGVSTTCNALDIVSATLTSSSGVRAKVRWWDDTRTIAQLGIPAGSCPVPAGGGYVVAERPLASGVAYTLRLELLAFDAPKAAKPRVHTVRFTAGGTGGTGAGDRTPPVVRVTSASARRVGSSYTYRLVASVRDSSPTTCTATVQRIRVRCVVRRGQVVLAGRRAGAPRTVAFALVVRDGAGNQRRIRAARAAR